MAQLPTSTYRLQFRNGMTFDRAIELIPHLKSLGISHLYASPIFAATHGSTHGYDVTDPNRIEPDLGGMDGLIRLSDALQMQDIGLILDIVPNHLAASLENPWWASLVKWGNASPHACAFDIDKSRRLTLPVLTGDLVQEIRNGHGSLYFDRSRGEIDFDYRGTRYPLNPLTYGEAFEPGPIQEAFAGLRKWAAPMSEEHFHAAFRKLVDGSETAPTLLGQAEDVASFLEQQPWKLIHWREAANDLSYRRFFEVTGLVGLKVEDEKVFQAAHETVLDLVANGRVQGLRIDHIDGLADPAAYLKRLRAAVGPDTYLVVEKILEGDETLPEDWPISGTTGYEFIASVAGLFTANDTTELDKAWAKAAPEFGNPAQELQTAKRLLTTVNFRGEVQMLQTLAMAIVERSDAATMDSDLLCEAVAELVAGFEVYRTYGAPEGLSDRDREILDHLVSQLAAEMPRLEQAFDLLKSIVRDEVGADNHDDAIRFRTRLQHLTGPVLAKSLEDTFFYRYNRLIALNEVGGDPISRDGGIARFHARMQDRSRLQPHALTTTSTHDTKRGEDSRARLYTLSEAPALWADAVDRWRAMNAEAVTALADGPAPEPAVEWLIYQALAGVLELNFDAQHETQMADLQDRFLPYLEKALREAKLRTNWSSVDASYEDAVKHYASQLLSPENKSFLDDFRVTLKPFIEAGVVNSLSQALLKLTVPGVPDIYNGCEGFDFSLVDPDNRRAPDFALLEPASSEPLHSDPVALKSWLVATVLRVRMDNPDLFSQGEYLPLETTGEKKDHVVAFERRHDGQSLIVVIPVLVFDGVRSGNLLTEDYWAGTAVTLPDHIRKLADISGNAPFSTKDRNLPIARIFAERPFACLMSEPEDLNI